VNLRFLLAGVLFLPAGSPARLSAQDSVPTGREHCSRRDVLIPMRDGVRLFTTIYAPGLERRLPILLTRTPYGSGTCLSVRRAHLRPGRVHHRLSGRARECQSEGFVNARPFNPAKKGTEIDEASDAYDTIGWSSRTCRQQRARGAVQDLASASIPPWAS
jgi:predicted acyl esterase